jgi:SAM-dependent methyltransferase
MSDPQGLWYASLAEAYDRGRAGYPPAILDGIEAETVLDLAAGTGKLTALLAERYPEVVAVEPVAAMRALLERNVPGVRALDGTAEAIPVGDESLDAVFVAEAFHWFDSAAAGRELERVLRPGGWLVVCFNFGQGEFVPGLGSAAREVLEQVMAGLPPSGGPRIETGAWREGLAAFEPLEERVVDHEWTTDAAGVASYYVSVSSTGSLSDTARGELRQRLLELTPPATHRLALTARTYRGRRRARA